jgi:hypothetical protein
MVLDFFTSVEVLQLLLDGSRQKQFTNVPETVDSAVAFIISCLILQEAVLDSSMRVCDAVSELYVRAASLAAQSCSSTIIEIARAIVSAMIARIVELDAAVKQGAVGRQRRCWITLTDMLASLEENSNFQLQDLVKVSNSDI